MKIAKTRLLAVGISILIVSSVLMVLLLQNHGNRLSTNNTVRVACVGDSITEWSKYPADLQVKLGNNCDVRNFGVSGSAVLLSSDKPYMNQTAFYKAKEFQPSMVVIMLGTNDARANNYPGMANFTSDYKKLVGEYLKLENKPKIWLVKPPPIFDNDLGLNDTNLEEGVIPGIQQVANELGLPTIDVNAALTNHTECFEDGIHPNTEGAELIASEISDAITFNVASG
jgi:acyl-CoA thioesterase-1